MPINASFRFCRDAPPQVALASLWRISGLVMLGLVLLIAMTIASGPWVDLPLGLAGLTAGFLTLLVPEQVSSPTAEDVESDLTAALHSLTQASLLTMVGFQLLA